MVRPDIDAIEAQIGDHPDGPSRTIPKLIAYVRELEAKLAATTEEPYQYDQRSLAFTIDVREPGFFKFKDTPRLSDKELDRFDVGEMDRVAAKTHDEIVALRMEVARLMQQNLALQHTMLDYARKLGIVHDFKITL